MKIYRVTIGQSCKRNDKGWVIMDGGKEVTVMTNPFECAMPDDANIDDVKARFSSVNVTVLTVTLLCSNASVSAPEKLHVLFPESEHQPARLYPKEQTGQEKAINAMALPPNARSMQNSEDHAKWLTQVTGTKNTGLRYNQGKPQWSIVHWKSLEPMVRVLEYGAHKYSTFEDPEIPGVEIQGKDIPIAEVGKYRLVRSGVDNWKGGMGRKDLLNCAMRHLMAMMDGEENDKESKEHHLGHVFCNMLFYSYNLHNNKNEDWCKARTNAGCSNLAIDCFPPLNTPIFKWENPVKEQSKRVLTQEEKDILNEH